MRFMRLGTAILAIGASVFAVSGQAEAEFVDLITNGDFETGDLTGWTIANLGDAGSFSIDTPGTTTPITGLPTQGNPRGGSFYAVSDQGGPGTRALLQSFTVPQNFVPVQLSFDMFVNNWGEGPSIDQQARVDILVDGASPFSTDPADILRTFYLGDDPGGFAANPHPFTSYNFDISGLSLISGLSPSSRVFDISDLLPPGATGQLRFMEPDSVFPLNLGFDNVMLVAVSVPEPSSLVLACAGSICMAIGVARRKWQGRE